jgi:hypothetical protein
MKLKLTALAFLGLSHVASASEIIPLSIENLTQQTNKAKSTHRDCYEIIPLESEDEFLKLVMNPSTASKAAVYALKKQLLFSGDQLYLFARMLLKVDQDYTANILFEQIINTKTHNTSPENQLKIAKLLKLKNPLLSAKAYLYVTQNPQASRDEKALAETEYRSLKLIPLR